MPSGDSLRAHADDGADGLPPSVLPYFIDASMLRISARRRGRVDHAGGASGGVL